MRHNRRIALLILFFLIGTHKANSETPFRQPLEPIAAPTTGFRGPSGERVNIDNFNGQFLVVNFWATWCVPCVKELPALERLAKMLHSNNVRVLLINQDRGGSAVATAFLKKAAVQELETHVDSQSSFARELGVRGLPTTVVINEAGKVIARHEGVADWDSPDVIQSILDLRQSPR